MERYIAWSNRPRGGTDKPCGESITGYSPVRVRERRETRSINNKCEKGTGFLSDSAVNRGYCARCGSYDFDWAGSILLVFKD